MEKNATHCRSWSEFVNVYRMFFGTNAGLDASGVRALDEQGLRAEIVRMKKILVSEGMMRV